MLDILTLQLFQNASKCNIGNDFWTQDPVTKLNQALKFMVTLCLISMQLMIPEAFNFMC